jgi:hypothetical protein
LIDGYAGMKARETQIPPLAKKYLAQALERIIRLYEAWGQTDKADPWRRERIGLVFSDDPFTP